MQHVRNELSAWTHAQTSRFVVWESAMMVERNVTVDRMLVVDTPDHIQMNRILVRNPDWTAEQIKTMLGLQLSRHKRMQAATDIIHNDFTLESVKQQVSFLCRTYNKIWSPDE